MHEYVHDYFQYGRPELINKISRKALAMRKSFKPKSIYNNEDHLVYLSPLQKARRSLREALRKAAQNMFIQDSPRQSNEDLNFEWEDPQDELCDSEENIQLDWLLTKYYDKSKEQFPVPDLKGVSENKKKVIENDNNFGNNIQEENLITFKDTNEQTNENFSTPFLSMPDLEPEPNEEKTGIELLAEFNIGHDPDQSVIRDVNQNKEREQISLNCVLPSISNDDVSIEKDNETLNHYNGEWDQMFNDIMISKVNNQDSGSELKELYSQISRTIDLLND
ncbi:unnamed protein product [Diatraea saccharalis]|uniref:Uncharacterized protein n=1 Tax=Diatraea saccharalis TaxID=40085 RepID=A0A9N9WBF2_9NEOP|nr:unnamed protein product [Diatraea saccharalis]